MTITKNFSVEIQKKLNDAVTKLDAEFPTAEQMSHLARIISNEVFGNVDEILTNPDKKLLQWIEVEYQLFSAIEEAKYGEKIRGGFKDMQEFLDIANSIMNRRKVRAGKSLEYQLSAIFDGNNLLYDSQVVTEANKKPDFIFPSSEAYHNPLYDANKLIVLASKTTCKDRWRQILNEADRVRDRNKYLFTLQKNISARQLLEMQLERVILVAPEPYIASYPPDFRNTILCLSEFIDLVRNTIY